MSDNPLMRVGHPSWRDAVDPNSLDPRNVMDLDASAETERRFVALTRERNRKITEDAQRAYQQAQLLNTERSIVDTLSDTELRDKLQEMIAQYDAALVVVGVAQANVERARERMETADADLHAYADIDDRIVAWRVDQLRRNLDQPMPSDLLHKQAERGRIADRIHIEHKAFERLSYELKDAEAKLAEVAERRSQVASFVILKHANAIATELSEALDVVNEKRRQLASIGSTWVKLGNGTVPLALSPFAKDTLNAYAEIPGPASSYQAAVRDWHNRLINDAYAEVGDMQP